jgi:hypothetical protein
VGPSAVFPTTVKSVFQNINGKNINGILRYLLKVKKAIKQWLNNKKNILIVNITVKLNMDVRLEN